MSLDPTEIARRPYYTGSAETIAHLYSTRRFDDVVCRGERCVRICEDREACQGGPTEVVLRGPVHEAEAGWREVNSGLAVSDLPGAGFSGLYSVNPQLCDPPPEHECWIQLTMGRRIC